ACPRSATPPPPPPLPPDVGLIGVRSSPHPHPQSPREPARRDQGRPNSEPGGDGRAGRVASRRGVLRNAKPSEGEKPRHTPHHPAARGRSQRQHRPPPRPHDP